MFVRWQRHWHDVWAGYTHRQQIAATVAAVLAGLGLLAWPAWQFWAAPRVHDWRVNRTLAQAARFDANQDYRNLLLSVRRAAQLGSADLEVWRRIAGYLTRLGSPEAQRARETVVRLAPASDLVAQVELAQTALLFGDYKSSQTALQAAAPLAPSNAAYHHAAATLALYLGDITTLKDHLAALVKANPDNAEAAFDLAAARLWSPDPNERAQGVSTLAQLLAQPALRVRCALELLKDAARAQDAAQLERTLPALLDALDFPADTTVIRPGLNRLLLGLKTTATGTPADIARVAAWMSDIRLGREALQWIHSLPPGLASDPAVREIAAEIALRENLVPATSFYLLENALGSLPAEAAVLAAGARQLEALNRLAAAQAAWDEAVEIANGARSPEALRTMARIGALWGQGEWTEKALRAAIRRTPDAFWAYAGLRDQLLLRDSATELWELYQDWLARQPDDLTVVIQWLRLGVCLPVAESEIRRRAPGLLRDLPASPRVDAALAGWHAWLGDEESARRQLENAGAAPHHEPDVAYWAALIERPERPNEAFPALARLRLLTVERARLTADPSVPAGLPDARSDREVPSLRVR